MQQPRQLFEELELEWARWNQLNSDGMVACSSGTSALHLALESLKLPPGSEVVVPDYTMVACARAVSIAGHVPVFVDCGEDLLMDTSLLAKAVSQLTDGSPSIKAIMSVGIYGRVCENVREHVVDAAEEWDCPIVEDLAEVHGVRLHEATDAACWSFYKNKIIHGEEGGAVWFRDPKLAHLARQLRSLGNAGGFQHVPRGHNYRMSNAHARLIMMSLTDAPWGMDRRREAERVCDELCPDGWRMPARQSPWVYDVRIPEMTHTTQDRIVGELVEMGVQARHGFKPMHLQEEYRFCRRVGGGVAERMAREIIYLPLTLVREQYQAAFEMLRRQVGK